MKVKEIMTRSVRACRPDAKLSEAATMMWDHDCGVIPVVDEGARVVGMITDRDICMALATRQLLASQANVADVMSRNVYACQSEMKVKDALGVMQEQQLHRLPVVDEEGALVGILSFNDVALHAKRGESKKEKHISHKDVMATLKALCAHRMSNTREEEFVAAQFDVE